MAVKLKSQMLTWFPMPAKRLVEHIKSCDMTINAGGRSPRADLRPARRRASHSLSASCEDPKYVDERPIRNEEREGPDRVDVRDVTERVQSGLQVICEWVRLRVCEATTRRDPPSEARRARASS